MSLSRLRCASARSGRCVWPAVPRKCRRTPVRAKPKWRSSDLLYSRSEIPEDSSDISRILPGRTLMTSSQHPFRRVDQRVPGPAAPLSSPAVPCPASAIGAMQLGRLHDDRDAALALLRRAIDCGVDHIDTAQFYGDGFVNEAHPRGDPAGGRCHGRQQGRRHPRPRRSASRCGSHSGPNNCAPASRTTSSASAWSRSRS